MLPLLIAYGASTAGKILTSKKRKKQAKKLARRQAREQQLQAGLQKDKIREDTSLATQDLAERFAKMGRAGTGQQQFGQELINKGQERALTVIDSQLRQGIYSQRQSLNSEPGIAEQFFGAASNALGAQVIGNYATPTPPTSEPPQSVPAPYNLPDYRTDYGIA